MLRDNPKRADGGEHAAVFAIQFVQVFAIVLDQLALQTSWQIQAVHKRITRVIALAIVTVVAPAFVLACVVAVTRIKIHDEPPFDRYWAGRPVFEWAQAMFARGDGRRGA